MFKIKTKLKVNCIMEKNELTLTIFLMYQFTNRHVYELLLDFKEKLEVKFESLDIDTL